MGVTDNRITNISFEDFTLLIQDKLIEYYGDNYTIKMNTVLKNNNKSLVGITICHKDEKISPTIYLDAFYEKYSKNLMIDECVSDIIRISEENQVEEEIDFSFFESYAEVRKRIVYKLINYDKNLKLLQDIPYVKYLNLAIVFYYSFEDMPFGNASILIHNSHMEMWNVSIEEVYQDAILNSPELLKAKIRNMKEIMLETFYKESNNYLDINKDTKEDITEQQFSKLCAEQLLDDMFETDNFHMYVLSNEANSFGAACILYRDLLKNFANEIGQGFYVLPSSIHEIILVPEDEVGNGNGLLSMVQEVNRNEVAEEEILADSVYYYDLSKEELVLYA